MINLKTHAIVIGVLIVIVLGGGLWFIKTIGEVDKPSIKFSEDIRTIGRQKVIQIAFGDKGSGLRSISVTLSQDKKSYLIGASNFPQKGTNQKTMNIAIDTVALKFHDGLALLNVVVVDRSVWKNKITIERPVNIDLTPPQIYLLTPTNNINPGGTCVVAFRTSEPAVSNGVLVNNDFTDGYPATFGGKQAVIAYFGLPLDAGGKGTGIRVIVRDGGGNETGLTLSPLIRKKKFRSDKMILSDDFLNKKMLDFQPLPPELQGKNPLEIFTYINAQMRNANESTIRELCRKSVPRQLWEGTFLRMKNASPMAQFGDHRTYIYGNKSIGESTHYGVDLASTVNAPVEAGNSGIVVFTGTLGIYGNAIIIDHGFGIFTIYGHLSQIKTKAGQPVKKGDVIGNTGTTGLAGGDHLHFGMIAGGRFVNPVEWWDPHWINDNVSAKLAQAS